MGGGPTAAGPCPPGMGNGEDEGSRGAWQGQKRQCPFQDPGPAHGPVGVARGGPVILPSSQLRSTGPRAPCGPPPCADDHEPGFRVWGRNHARAPCPPLGARGLSTWGRSFCPAKGTEILRLTPWRGGSGDQETGHGELQAPSSAASNRSPTARHGVCTRFSAPPLEAERTRRPHSPAGRLRAREAPGAGLRGPPHPAQGGRAPGPPSDRLQPQTDPDVWLE